jgi:hypothetical protein
MTLIDHLIKSVQAAAKVNRTVQTPPATILWTDKERHWEAVAAGLHARMLDPDMNDSVDMNIQPFRFGIREAGRFSRSPLYDGDDN